jgi:hypothetical protein
MHYSMAWFVFGFSVAAIVVGVVVRTQQNESSSVVATQSPTPCLSAELYEIPLFQQDCWTSCPLINMLGYTQECIKKGRSPQYQAWEWLSRH